MNETPSLITPEDEQQPSVPRLKVQALQGLVPDDIYSYIAGVDTTRLQDIEIAGTADKMGVTPQVQVGALPSSPGVEIQVGFIQQGDNYIPFSQPGYVSNATGARAIERIAQRTERQVGWLFFRKTLPVAADEVIHDDNIGYVEIVHTDGTQEENDKKTTITGATVVVGHAVIGPANRNFANAILTRTPGIPARQLIAPLPGTYTYVNMRNIPTELPMTVGETVNVLLRPDKYAQYQSNLAALQKKKEV